LIRFPQPVLEQHRDDRAEVLRLAAERHALRLQPREIGADILGVEREHGRAGREHRLLVGGLRREVGRLQHDLAALEAIVAGHRQEAGAAHVDVGRFDEADDVRVEGERLRLVVDRQPNELDLHRMSLSLPGAAPCRHHPAEDAQGAARPTKQVRLSQSAGNLAPR
jgi:hypothetical protein